MGPRKSVLLSLVVLCALALSLYGCSSSGRVAYRTIPRSLVGADHAISSYDDLARRTGVPVRNIETPTLASRIFAWRFRLATIAPRLDHEEREFVKEGGCAILDYKATFGFGPTDETIDNWLIEQAVDLASPPGQTIRRKLMKISTMTKDEQLSNEGAAQVIGIVCVAPVP